MTSNFEMISGPISLLADAEAGAAAKFTGLGNLPYWVMGGYLVLLLVLGILGWIKSKAGEEDYYLASRGQGWFVSSLTIMATFFSSFALLGAPGMVYREGVVFALFSLNVPVAGLCVYLLGVRIWRLGRKFRFVTPGDMVSKYYGSKYSLRMLVALAGFLYAIPYVVMQIQAGGLVSQELFPEWGDTLPGLGGSFEKGAILLAVITMVYIMVGGMRSVAWTDAIQGMLLISGMLVAGFAMFLVFDGVGEFSRRVTTELPESSLTSPGNSGTWQWTMVFTVCVLGSAGSMVQPAQWMRFYSARSPQTLRRGALVFGVVLTTCFILGVMLIGIAGQVRYPLQFRHAVPVGHLENNEWVASQGPGELTNPIPEDLRVSFSYVPPKKESDESGTISWTWYGNDRVLPQDDLDRLLLLSDHEDFQNSIVQLRKRVADASIQPDVLPNPKVDADPTKRKDFDAILVTVLQNDLPAVLGQFGAIFATLLLVSVMAASMSTADSNLHALSAVLTRDIYDQYIRPKASDREKVWVGRIIIMAATAVALLVVILGRNPNISAKFDFMNMIAMMGLMAIAFSAQLLPMAIDVLFLRKGTGAGAAWGLGAGLFGAFLFGPLFGILNDSLGNPSLLAPLSQFVADTKNLLKVDGVMHGVHGSVWGLALNVPIFVLVSLITRRVPKERKAEFAEVMRGECGKDKPDDDKQPPREGWAS